MKGKTVTIVIVCVVILIPLLIFAFNEAQKQPLDLRMYGAEINADGSVIQETEFSIKGYLRENQNSDLAPYDIYFEPITFKGNFDIIISLEGYQRKDIPVLLHGDLDNPSYCIPLFAFFQGIHHPATIYLCHERCCCLIDTHGRYFAGATKSGTAVRDILAHFPEIDLTTDN